MEDIESFFEIMVVFIAIIGGLISTVKKSQQNRVREAAKQSAAQMRMAVQPQSKTTPRQAPTDSPVLPGMSFGDVPGQVMMPTVHPHVQPDCDTHDAPGSMGVTSTEGKDPCHAEQLDHLRMPEETTAPEQDGLTFSWTGSDLVKAVVMQEVLTRPANRAPIAGRRAQ